MSTSGNVNLNTTRDEIIGAAFGYLNIYDPAEVIDPNDKVYAANRLNAMIKTWEAQSIHLWAKTEATLFLQINQTQYTLTLTGDHATNSYVETTIGADEASGQTTLTLTSTAGMTANDHIGIVLDSGYFQWTTISSITDSTTLVIANALTDSATSGNAVYAYTSKINRPLQVYSCRRYNNGQDTPLWLYAYSEYFDLPNKANPGIPTSFMYNPQRNTGLLYIWPAPEEVSDLIKFSYARPLDIFTTATDEPDFPQEWIEVLGMQLAVRISYRYGRRNQVQALKNDADMMLQNLLDWDNEDASIYLQPARY